MNEPCLREPLPDPSIYKIGQGTTLLDLPPELRIKCWEFVNGDEDLDSLRTIAELANTVHPGCAVITTENRLLRKLGSAPPGSDPRTMTRFTEQVALGCPTRIDNPTQMGFGTFAELKERAPSLRSYSKMRIIDDDAYIGTTTGTLQAGADGRTVLTAIIPHMHDRRLGGTYRLPNLPFPKETEVEFVVEHLQLPPRTECPSLPAVNWIDLEVYNVDDEYENAGMVPTLQSLLAAQLTEHGPTHLERISLAFGSHYTASQMMEALDVITKSGFAPQTVELSRSQVPSSPVSRALTLDTNASNGISCLQGTVDLKSTSIPGSLPPHSHTAFHLNGLKLPELEEYLSDGQKPADPGSSYSYIASRGEQTEQFAEALRLIVSPPREAGAATVTRSERDR